MQKFIKINFVMLLVSLIGSFSAVAQEKISVAVASNFIPAFQEMAADFEKKSGVKVEGAFSSTGSLHARIQNGAAYDVFLSADIERPDLLQKEGLTDGTFIYARGQIVLWAADKQFCQAATWQESLKNAKIKKLAIADPLTSPYGASAKTVLTKAGLWDELQSRLVIVETVEESLQYASTQAVDAGFCALSAATRAEGERGCFYRIAEAPDIVQAGCILKSTKKGVLSELFMAYLLCDSARDIRKKRGYR